MDAVIISGTFLGLVYGLFAVGLTVVYRGAKVINFAHGNTGMVAAFFFAEFWMDWGAPLVVALVAAVLVGAGLGAVTELAVVRPLRDAPRATVMIATVAMASLLLVFASRRWGLRPRFVENLAAGDGIQVAGLQILPAQLLILVASVAVMAVLLLLYRFTAFGLRLRAVALDAWAAGQVGVNTSLVSMATWALAGAISAVSAILVAPLVSFDVFFMTAFLIRGLAAALIGGLTSVSGAFGAGVMLGVTEALLRYGISAPGIAELGIALLIITAVMIRPTGLVRSAY